MSPEGADTHPGSVTIQLLQNGNVYDEVTLSARNGWRHTWLNLNASSHWKVVEKDVPAGYTVAIAQDGTAFVVTNTRSASSANPLDHLSAQNPPNQSNKPRSLLPQTGQLWWPVPLLTAVGMIIFIFSWGRRKRGNDEQKKES